MRGLRKNKPTRRSPFVMTLVVVVMVTFASPPTGNADATVDALFAALPDPRESPYDYRDRAFEFCALRGHVDRDQLIPYLKRIIENNSMFACIRDPDDALARILDWEAIDAVSDRCLKEISLIEGPDVTAYLWRYFQTAAGFEDRRDEALSCRTDILEEFNLNESSRAFGNPVNAGDILTFIEIQSEWLHLGWNNLSWGFTPYQERFFEIYLPYCNSRVGVVKRPDSTHPLPSGVIAASALNYLHFIDSDGRPKTEESGERSLIALDAALRNATVWNFPRSLTQCFLEYGNLRVVRGFMDPPLKYRRRGWSALPTNRRLEFACAMLLNLDRIVGNSDIIRPYRHAQHVASIIHLTRKSYWNQFAGFSYSGSPSQAIDDAELARRRLTLSAILGVARIRTPEGCEALNQIISGYRKYPSQEYYETAMSASTWCAENTRAFHHE